ncbi:MAG: response regulator [Pseudomonadota bacterium]|nr:response regulator [Pseudomonadota bacterium]
MRILLVEDDQNLGLATQEGLKEAYAVDWVTSAEDAQAALRTTEYNLMVLDINLPGQSGLEFLKIQRQRKNMMPVLLLTARDAVQQKVEGLNAGADDYLVKPFDLDELLARCAALIRRGQGQATPQIQFQDITYEVTTGYLLKNGEKINLSGREKAIFDVLIQNIDRIYSRNALMSSIYDWQSEDIESNTIEVHIASIRKKMGKDFIKTIRGIGYMIPS